MLKRVSRSRSEVGRTCNDGGLLRCLPRYSPAIILKLVFRSRFWALVFWPLSAARTEEAVKQEPRRLLTDVGKAKARVQTQTFYNFEAFWGGLFLAQVEFGFFPRLLQYGLVSHKISQSELRQA